MTIKTLVKLTTLAGLLAWALPAHAGKFYNLDQKTSSATLRVGYEGADRTDAVFISSGAAVVQSTSATATHKFFRLLNNAAAEVLSMTQNGVLTASSFVGNLTGNVVGNVTGALTGNADTATLATLATAATNLASGAVGQFHYQSGSGASAFLPAMGAGGIITGNGTSAIPSTGTFTGTASQVTITRTNANVVLSLPATINVNTSGLAGTATALAADGANCGAGNYPLGVDASGAVQGCTAAGSGDVSQSGANTFTNTNTFSAASTTTVNGVIIGTWRCYTSSAAISGKDAVITVPINSGATDYAIYANGVQTNSTDIFLKFNADGGSNYQCNNHYIVNAGASSDCTSGSTGWNASYGSLIGVANTAATGDWSFRGGFTQGYGLPLKVNANGTGTYKHTVAVNMWAGGPWSIDYNGAAVISSVSLGVAAGTFGGRLTVCELRTN